MKQRLTSIAAALLFTLALACVYAAEAIDERRERI